MIRNRIEKLRELMKSKDISAYIVPTSDPHQSENIADCFKTREYISGFTGSAGTAVITLEKAGLWVDGRYYIQAAKQIENSGIDLFKLGLKETQSIYDFIKENTKENDIIGFNGENYSYFGYLDLQKNIGNRKINIDETLIEDIWEDRPSAPTEEIFLHNIEFTGMSSKDKINEVRKSMKKTNVKYHLISSLDDICYLLNIRGNDIAYNPVALSYLVLSDENAIFYVDSKKLTDKVIESLKENGVDISDYEDIFEDLKKIKANSSIYLDKSKTNIKAYLSLNEKLEKINGIDFSSIMKAVKNETEIKNQRNAYLKDGVALVKFFNWIETNVEKMEITEISASNKLLDFRKAGKFYVEESFKTISAYGQNAALPHYTPSDLRPIKLEGKGLYLVDSGGQYFDGTTDITRTVALGELTEDEKLHYTYTLKSHIQLMTFIFKEDTKCSSIDTVARKPLWEIGVDFNHGTGHGVGYFLYCHEGPQSIRRLYNDIDMVPGMITSNEPGIYIEGSHGVRIENIMLCIEKFRTDFGKFYGFEPLSLCPIDVKPIIKELLTENEVKWLNEYHKECREKLSPYLEGEDLEYLNKVTKEI